jgi:E3 ubiquitin-protein ligase RNF14
MRLWELEEGDGDDVGIGYGGGVRPVQIPPEQAEEAPVEFVNEAAAPPVVDIPEVVIEPPPPVPQEELEREGPLVLRINPLPQPVQVAPAVPGPPPANRRNAQRQGPQDVRRQPGAPIAGRRPYNRGGLRQRGREDLARERDAANQEAAQQAWVQMFVQMALNDEEDLLDSDDENDDGAAWEIPVR